MILNVLLYALISHSVTLKATGLTCSMCSFSIQKGIEKIHFVDSVKPNLEETTYTIYFKENKFIDFFTIENAVEDAGFFVDKTSSVVNTDSVDNFTINSNYIYWKTK
tara:strand:- start:372 stop:692 length:321 start_codon:yes stop_codon:yes gene_type:complete